MNNSANQSLTAQQIFDKVVSHLRRQGRKSHLPCSNIGDQPMQPLVCAYRGKGGSMCAAGCLIEDSEYSKNFEGLSIRSLLSGEYWCECKVEYVQGIKHAPISMRERLLPHVDLICYLQDCHDNYWVENWEKKFAEIAERFNLSYSPA